MFKALLTTVFFSLSLLGGTPGNDACEWAIRANVTEWMQVYNAPASIMAMRLRPRWEQRLHTNCASATGAVKDYATGQELQMGAQDAQYFRLPDTAKKLFELAMAASSRCIGDPVYGPRCELDADQSRQMILIVTNTYPGHP